MSHEHVLAVPDVVLSHESPAPPVDVDLPGVEAPAPPTAEQVRTADQVFTKADDADQIYNLLGAWTGLMILRDVAVDTMTIADEEGEERPRLDGRRVRP
jgi:hypothetical protein